MACSRRESILEAARLGLGALTFSFASPDEARPWVRDYYRTIENECEPLGYAVNPNIAIAAPFLCDRDLARVEAVAAEHYGFFVYGLGHYSFFGEHRPGKTDLWNRYKTDPRADPGSEFTAKSCIGTPAMLRERLRAFEDAGIDQVVAVRQVGKLSLDQQCSSLRLFAEEVLPEFKERELASARQQAERRARITEKAMARKPKSERRPVEIVIPSAGHH